MRPGTVTLFHDIEQNVNVEADPAECREAVRQFLDVEASLGVHATYNVVGRLMEKQGDLMAWIRDAGHEIAFHSYQHKVECPPDEFAKEIALCRAISDEPRGYRSPQSRWNTDTLQSLLDFDFDWNAEGDPGPKPYFIYKRLVRLPIAADDWPLHTRELTVEDWVERFRELLRQRPYVALGSHDCVVSLNPGERLDAWRRCIKLAREAGARFMTFGAAAAEFDDRRALER